MEMLTQKLGGLRGHNLDKERRAMLRVEKESSLGRSTSIGYSISNCQPSDHTHVGNNLQTELPIFMHLGICIMYT